MTRCPGAMLGALPSDEAATWWRLDTQGNGTAGKSVYYWMEVALNGHDGAGWHRSTDLMMETVNDCRETAPARPAMVPVEHIVGRLDGDGDCRMISRVLFDGHRSLQRAEPA
ncbi:hypothetical protein CONPUDRAFT_71749 [Coniophora puteana RWD-64-598 SS2]|uniref:Uncharacterized protein n=1 Tax=Coniophora puteana (strain RWD-64-598) TaxID=741705 RepID=A0A5M3MWK9_CONPW|nr:uncharacterized protein CONPUDRAFT_71749 [Coniophora puteana RWD-64-598 SS2]EIW83134.1 hypothetical protein CONPUDRAFT_71749 [Coniophora puteana RWD-64-598 SS2]